MKRSKIGKFVITLSLAFTLMISGVAHAAPVSEEEQTIVTAERLLSATVQITSDGNGKVLDMGRGSGFFIEPNLILTNEHVIHKGSSKVNFEMYDGSKCYGTVGYREEGLDLALIKSVCTSAISLGFSLKPKVGQTVIAVGNPGDYPFTVTKGILSSVRNFGLLQYDARINYGSSGGVLANLDGAVLGVINGISKSDPAFGFAIKSENVIKFLERSKG
jgi:serine protease Do